MFQLARFSLHTEGAELKQKTKYTRLGTEGKTQAEQVTGNAAGLGARTH